MEDSRRLALERWRDEKRRKQEKQKEVIRKVARSARRVIAHREGLVHTQNKTKRQIFPSLTMSAAVRQVVSHSAVLVPILEGQKLLHKTPAKARTDTGAEIDQTSATPSSEESLHGANKPKSKRRSYISPSYNTPSLAGGAQRVLKPTRALLELNSGDDGWKDGDTEEISPQSFPGPRRVSRLPGQIGDADGVPVTPFKTVKDKTGQNVTPRETVSFGSIGAALHVSPDGVGETNDIKNSAILESPGLQSRPVTGEEKKIQQPLAVQEVSSTSHDDTISNSESSRLERELSFSDRFPVLIPTRTSLDPRLSCESSFSSTSRDDIRPKPMDGSNGNTKWEKNDFSVTKELGRGRFGIAYLAKVKGSNVSVALKVLSKVSLKHADGTGNLKREIEIQVRLRHPNVLTMHGYFYDEKNVYLVLEYAPHGELFKELTRKTYFDDAVAAHYVAEVIEALKYCHSCDVIHRDIKAENILLGYNNTIKLADFGWSVHAPWPYKVRKTFCGTPDYLSPEMVLNKPYDYRTDTWSLGVLTYELLVGETPFHCKNKWEMYERIKLVDYRFPETPTVSDNARHFIEQLLKKEPSDRIELKDASQHPWIRNRH